MSEAGDFIDLIDAMQKTFLEIPYRRNLQDTVIGEEQILLGVIILEVDGLQDMGAD